MADFSFGAAGGGAAVGLDHFLQQMLEEEKLKRLTDATNAQQQETSRHNLATEDLAGRQHTMMATEADARTREMSREHDLMETARQRDDARVLGDTIPSGTVLDPTDPAVQMMQSGGQASLLKMQAGRPTVDTGPLEPGDTGDARQPGLLKMRSFGQANTEAGRKVQADELARQNARDAETVKHDRAMENKPPAVALVNTETGFQTKADVAKKLAAGETVGGPEAAQTKNRRDLAEAVGSHFDDVNNLLDEAESKGLLGPLKGRTFVDFMAGKVGSTGNAENDQLLGDLRTQLGMVRTGVAALHGRTGANVGIAKDIEKKMDEGYMDVNLIKGGLKGLRSWVDTYAKKKGSSAVSNADPLGILKP
jgi:hypothetical protein